MGKNLDEKIYIPQYASSSFTGLMLRDHPYIMSIRDLMNCRKFEKFPKYSLRVRSHSLHDDHSESKKDDHGRKKIKDLL